MRKPLLLLSPALLLLASCGSGGGSNDSPLYLSVSDTPTDGATHVTLAFTAVSLTPGASSDDMDMMNMGMGMMDMSGSTSPVTLQFPQERTVDLLQQQGGKSAALIDGLQVPVGSYTSITFTLDLSRSNITLADGSVHPLGLPGSAGNQISFALPLVVSDTHGPTTPDASQNRYTVDFDLRQAITASDGNYVLAPMLRLVDDQKVGEVRGSASNTAIIGGRSISDPVCKPAAYIYVGEHVVPMDINPTSSVQPLTTASLELDTTTGDYQYTAAFLPAGSYTVAFVCAGLDDPSKLDDLSFTAAQNVTVAFATPVIADLR